MTEPLVFISHKHADEKIAEAIADCVRTITGGHTTVHVSSSSDYEHSGISGALKTQLADRLKRAGIVILLYTSKEQDWSFCSWECGVALDPDTPDTKIIGITFYEGILEFLKGELIIQFGRESTTDLEKFVKSFGKPKFYPGIEKPLSKLSERELHNKAIDLHKELLSIVPNNPIETRSLWPKIQLKIRNDDLDDATNADKASDRIQNIYDLLVNSSIATDWTVRVPTFFGKEGLVPGCLFSDFFNNWKNDCVGLCNDHWLYTLAQQIHDIHLKNVPGLKEWARFRPLDSSDEYVVGLGEFTKHAIDSFFNCYFYKLVNVPMLSSVIIDIDHAFYKDIEIEGVLESYVIDLVAEMEEKSKARLPILNDGKPFAVIHLSKIDQYLRKQGLSEKQIESLTLGEMTSNEDIKQWLPTSFAYTQADVTVAQALTHLENQDMCQDIFVTDTGELDGKVTGLVTDKNLMKAVKNNATYIS